MGYETPHIDRIAKEGIRLQHYYGEQSSVGGRLVGSGRKPRPRGQRRAVGFRREVRAIVDQLRIESHDGAARRDLPFVEESLLQVGDGGIDQLSQRSEVAASCQTVRQHGRKMSASA